MEYHQFFTHLDWAVVAGYLALTTWVGHALKGKQSTIKDFFLGGRTLPWPAVSGSIIATEISGVTFIGVPGMVYAATGDFTYLQWGLGSIIARILVGIYFVRAFYEKEIYSPYDYMGNRLGIGAKRLATIIFQIGGILGQSVRVLVAALALKVVTPLEFEHCIWIIGLFAVGWTWMGGMRTVIWTDVMQFFLFVGAGLLSLFWIISELDGGWSQMVETAGEAGKFSLINLTTDPAIGFTLWGSDPRCTISKPECFWGGPAKCPADVLLPRCRGCPQSNDCKFGRFTPDHTNALCGCCLVRLL